MTFLLRNPAAFDPDDVIQKHIESGKARLIKGDAMVRDDCIRAWEEAGRDRDVDALVFTVGQFLNDSPPLRQQLTLC